ncbi:hypothetical protein Pme01_27160 [Planosporangium mesophilum]|uniref:Uncharacterized protein n=1 Tax=Planosporangium mesophilum TaxID=689768 RepID=A0A8J3X1A4_9ACTN|nr:hypothetical protein Pme01_27160 [Planosporangium mesophilum]
MLHSTQSPEPPPAGSSKSLAAAGESKALLMTEAGLARSGQPIDLHPKRPSPQAGMRDREAHLAPPDPIDRNYPARMNRQGLPAGLFPAGPPARAR